MAGFGISGIASGIDTAGIIDQLMALERRSSTRIKLEQSRLTTRDSGLKDVSSKLVALRSAAQALRGADLWADKQTVESSSPTQVAAERLSGAGTGATLIRVAGLASSFQRTYDFAVKTASRTLAIKPQGGTAVDITVAAGATLDDVVAAINAKSDAAVYAAAVRTDPADPATARLVLSSRATGAASDFTMTDDGVAYADVAGTAKTGKDARYYLDGNTDPALVRTSATNVIDNAIPGLRLTLKATTAADISITVGAPAPDAEAVKAKLRTFVEAYNAVVTTARAKTSERAVPAATTHADALKGQLFGDQGLSALLNSFRAGASAAVAGNPTASDELLDLGISTGAIGAGLGAASGTLVIDEAKLAARLAAEPQAVRRLLGGVSGVDGFAQRIEGLVGQQIGLTDALETTGAIDQRLTGSVDQQRRLTDAMTRNEARLATKEKRLKAQFAAMESALQASQTQQSWLSGQLSALYR